MKFKFTKEANNLMALSQDEPTFAILDFAPKQGTTGSSGYDLSACISSSITLLADEERKIGTGVHIWIGSNTIYLDPDVKLAGFLMPRSSIKGCMLTNTIGLIDDDYQGEVIVSLWNRTDNPIIIMPGQKLVQLVYVFTFLPVMELVDDFDNITKRNTGAFGHTGD